MAGFRVTLFALGRVLGILCSLSVLGILNPGIVSGGEVLQNLQVL